MSFFTILETLLLGPLKLVFEIIFELANRMIGHPGLAIIVLSLIMNILVLPLYKRADAMQEETRDIEAKLHDGVAHIKKTFSGDERMMILQTYYRQNHYKPTDALNGSVSLLLEIPFFMAAYQFLSHLRVMEGVSLGPITDLSAPDGLLVIGGVAINILPILMTTVNLISSAIYLKGFPLKTKIQLYAMALFFLVFLYTSPSCLVFYWTLNNVFSLVKTIFYKIKNPKKVLGILTSVVGVALICFGLFIYDTNSLKRKAFLVAVGVLLQLPLVTSALKGKGTVGNVVKPAQPNRKLFLLGSLLLTVLVGLLIPSNFIAASPQEYVDISFFHNPLRYLVSSGCMAAGTFLIWMRVFYWLASPRGKVIFDRLVWVLCGVMLVNYMFFGTDLGVISSNLQYENGMVFSGKELLLNLLIVAVVAVIMYLFACKWSRAAAMVMLTAVIALGGMSAVNVVTIKKSVDELSQIQDTQNSDIASIELSKTGKNVIVLMLDRALGTQIPYIFNEKPELKEQFSGFTYYSNVLSFGLTTNIASPALFGGYEYTPVEMNKRDTESLVQKHNEALKVMPVTFLKNGFDVTVCDPVYANYSWVSDLSIFDEYPEIKTYITEGKFSDPKQKEAVIESNHRNFFCFSIMKTMPLVVQPTIYNSGRYNQAVSYSGTAYMSQTLESTTMANGISQKFMNSYNVLCNLPYITKVTEEDTNTFLSMTNNATHEPMLLQTPDYTPTENVDNTQYELENADRFVLDGQKLNMDDSIQMIHYHANMASLIQLGKWFDYLRANDVYDNTRIILVADHGRALHHVDALVMDSSTSKLDLEYYFPMMMVKDFDSEGFATSTDFMTNADVPALAMEGLIEEPVNPFTGKPITSDEKTAHDQYVLMSSDWETDKNNGNTFNPGWWASVKDSIWDMNNWTVVKEGFVLDQHKLP